MPTVFYIGLLPQVAALFILGAAAAMWFSRAARRSASTAQARHPVLLAALAAVLLIVGYVSLYLRFRLSFFTIAAYHVLDIPESRVHWLDWFFWGAYALPIAWVISVAPALTEFQLRRRRWLVTLYLSLPVITGLVHFLLWQFYLWSLR